MSHRRHYRGNFRSKVHLGTTYPAEYTHANIPLPFSHHERSMGAPVVEVAATIVKYERPVEDAKGKHQHFLIHIDHVEEVAGAPIRLVQTSANPTHADAFVAVRYGDDMGLSSPIEGLKNGVKLLIQGEYIDSADAYPSPDNPGLAVIHFTHHPVGFIQVGEKIYD